MTTTKKILAAAFAVIALGTASIPMSTDASAEPHKKH